jgi:hypothetical protein
MNQLLKPGQVPKWRLVLWASIAMAGVAYFIPHNGHPLLVSFCILSGGSLIFAMGSLLNWEDQAVRTNSPAGQWLRKNAKLLLAVFILGSVLVRLWGIFSHK